jgi:hypothetical protein
VNPAEFVRGLQKGSPNAKHTVGCNRLGRTLQRCERPVFEAEKRDFSQAILWPGAANYPAPTRTRDKPVHKWVEAHHRIAVAGAAGADVQGKYNALM